MRKPARGDAASVAGPVRAAARRADWHLDARGVSTALLTLAVVTAVCALIERHFEPGDLMMLYLAGVVHVALRAGRASAALTVLGSLLIYDLVFVPPRWSLQPREPHYWLAFLVVMVVGVIVSHLASRAREQALVADARARRAQALSGLARRLGQARQADDVSAALAGAVHDAVGAAACIVPLHGGRLADPDGPAQALGFDPAAAERALGASAAGAAAGIAERRGTLRYLPLRSGTEALAVLALRPPVAEHDTPEDRALVRAMADQAAVALARSVLEQRHVAKAIEAERERLRSTLLAGISHDFRTPLTTIVGSATTLLQQSHALDEAQRAALLRGLLDAARRLHQMSSDLLDLTRLEEGAIGLAPEWCPADELVGEALAALGTRLDGHRLQTAPMPEAPVWCDPRLVGQALVNLLDNAVRHTPRGGRIGLAIEVDAGCWRLVVHDDGPGVPAGHEQAVFRKFHRARAGSDDSGKGLGLAICAAVAQLHGGTIEVRNESGARFEMRLPQPAPPQVPEGEPE